MIIGIDASRAFLKNRTGIEEYSFQVIKHLRGKLKGSEVVLYLRPVKKKEEKLYQYERSGQIKIKDEKTGKYFKLPANWKIRIIKLPRLWTQVGLSLEMLLRPVDVLFIPAHTVPIINPNHFLVRIINRLRGKSRTTVKTIVTIHGLEYEFLPKAYSAWEKFYMRWSIMKSCHWATDIIAVSENTKKDLIKLYNVPAEKIEVVYEGVHNIIKNRKKLKTKMPMDLEAVIKHHKYLLFVGRIEERKNIIGIIKAFEILKNKHKIPHKLILVGGFGYGYAEIVNKVETSKYRDEIFLTGYVDEIKKQQILKNCSLFLFPTFYEGFGLPILEAQSMGVPVVASDSSAVPEIVGKSLKPFLVNPAKPRAIARVICKILSDKKLKNRLIRSGYKNVERFSWDGCAKNIAEIIKN